MTYLAMAMYGLLVILAVRNIWVILIKQKKYKNLPLAAFYAFALIALALRPIDLIGIWTLNPLFYNIDLMQQGAKLCVGFVQNWITLELAIRIQNARDSADISTPVKNKLRTVFAVVLVGLTLGFLAWSSAVLVSASKALDRVAFDESYCQVQVVIGYSFLCQVIVMCLLVAWLFVETYRIKAREKNKLTAQDGSVTNSLHKERCTYAIISSFFALSYVGRFILNEYIFGCGTAPWLYFSKLFTEVVIYLFEGGSMGVLMYFHMANFEQGSQFSSTKD